MMEGYRYTSSGKMRDRKSMPMDKPMEVPKKKKPQPKKSK